MLKNFSMKILAIVLILTAASADSLAQTRIRFTKGRSTTVSGKIPGNASLRYIVAARAGQMLTVRVVSGNGKIFVAVNNPGDDEGQDRTNEWSGTLSTDGDTAFFIDNRGKATNFTMTVTLR